MVADPEMIKEILVKEFQKFHDRKVKMTHSFFPFLNHLFSLYRYERLKFVFFQF